MLAQNITVPWGCTSFIITCTDIVFVRAWESDSTEKLRIEFCAKNIRAVWPFLWLKLVGGVLFLPWPFHFESFYNDVVTEKIPCILWTLITICFNYFFLKAIKTIPRPINFHTDSEINLFLKLVSEKSFVNSMMVGRTKSNRKNITKISLQLRQTFKLWRKLQKST